MSSLLIHNMENVWTSSGPALQIAVEAQSLPGVTLSCNRFHALPGAQGITATFTTTNPLDLSNYEELRFWIRSNRAADGTLSKPFFLEFSFEDAGDGPEATHRWLVPLNQEGIWEQRRIGIDHERRSAIQRFRFRCLSNSSFFCYLTELLAVRDEMLVDVEEALAEQISEGLTVVELSNVRLHPGSPVPTPGDDRIVLDSHRSFHVGNLIRIEGGDAGEERHRVTQVTHDSVAATTTLQFDAEDTIVGNLPVANTRISLLIPVLIEGPPVEVAPPTPSIIVTPLQVLDDPQRSPSWTQRDSFRLRGNQTTCSVRAPARAYVADYQVTANATDRHQQARLYGAMLRQLSADRGLRINGSLSPIWMLPAPLIDRRELGVRAPIYVRIGTRMETEARRESPWVRHGNVLAAPLDAPLDQEGIEINL